MIRRKDLFIGTVGSGKESHFSELEYDMGMVTVRLGDLIEKEAAKEDSELGDKIKDLVNLGEEIPDVSKNRKCIC